GRKARQGSMGYHVALAPDSASQVDSQANGPAQLIAFRPSETLLIGLWVNMPWYGSIDNAKWIKGNDSTGFLMNVGAIGRIIGKVPQAKSVRIKGAYTMHEVTSGFPGDGVIRINGAEIVRLKPGEKPYKQMP